MDTLGFAGTIAAALITAGLAGFLQWRSGKERAAADDKARSERLEAAKREASERAAIADREAAERAKTTELVLSERAAARREEFLFCAMEQFGGGTQKRSVGISIAEAFWRKVPKQIDILVPLLLNQVVYLLAVVSTEESKGAAHERLNLARILDLLAEIDRRAEFADAYESTIRTIQKRRPGSGMDLSASPVVAEKVAAFLAARP